MSVLTNTYLIFNCAYAKYGNYIFRSFLGNVCCKAVKFRMKLSCSGYVYNMATYMYIISGGISCGNWNTFPGKFSVRYYYWGLWGDLAT